MNKFKITPHENKEYHCKMALKAFDPNCKISIDKEILLVESDKLDIITIGLFTSVKEVVSDDNTLTINFTYTPPIFNLVGNTILNNNLNINPNNTCLTFGEVKTKIRNLLNSHLAHINYSSNINLFDNISNSGYILPPSDPNHRVIDILHPNNDQYDRNKCNVLSTSSHLCLSFDNPLTLPQNTIFKNVIDVYESLRGIVSIIYV